MNSKLSSKELESSMYCVELSYNTVCLLWMRKIFSRTLRHLTNSTKRQGIKKCKLIQTVPNNSRLRVFDSEAYHRQFLAQRLPCGGESCSILSLFAIALLGRLCVTVECENEHLGFLTPWLRGGAPR